MGKFSFSSAARTFTKKEAYSFFIFLHVIMSMLRAVLLGFALLMFLVVMYPIIYPATNRSPDTNSPPSGGSSNSPPYTATITEEYYVSPTPRPGGPPLPKVLITGGAGFIGSQLGWRLHTAGHEVVLLDNLAHGNRDNLEVDGKKFGRFVRGDIRNPNIASLFRGIDVVLHFAAISALPLCQEEAPYAYDVNLAGLVNVLEASRRYGVRRFIFSSTSAVYESNTRMPCREDDDVSPTLLYSLSKLHGEQLCHSFRKTYGMDIVILRFFNVYGPHQDFRRLSPPYTSYVVRELLNGRSPVLHSSGEQQRDYVYIEDLARLVEITLTHPHANGETFNVASNTSVSVNEILRIVARAVGGEAVRIQPSYAPAESFWKKYMKLYTGPRSMRKEILIKEVEKYTLGDNAKAKKILGWEPKVSMEEGLREMVRYVRQFKMNAQRGEFANAWKEG